MNEIGRILGESRDSAGYARGYLDHVADVLRRLDAQAVASVIDALQAARARGATIFLVGNGGSAATASHLANDLLAVPGSPAVRAWCLADSAPVLTARANDCGYDQVFTRQLQGRIGAGDVLIAISASGASRNVLAAVDLARAAGAVTIGLCGFVGGDLAPRCDHAVLVGAQPGEYGPVEGVHAVVAHIVANHLSLRGPAGP